MKEIIEVIHGHLSKPKYWDKNLPITRKKLKKLGYYKLPVDERNKLLQEAKSLK